ncbi:MAG: hypothetical protein R3F42_02905 [Pseudomonadota bacterium]
MTIPAVRPETRRIVVPLSPALCGRTALATAARLAGSLGAELEGVFIEDIDLIQLAGLSFLRELSPWSLAETAMDSRRMERQLRALARQARTLLEQEARKADVPWTFQVWRGRTAADVLIQAFSADILSPGRLSALASCRLWARAGQRRAAPAGDFRVIGVLAGQTEPALRAVATAARLASALDTALAVFLPALDAAGLLQLEQGIRSLLESLQQPARLVHLGGSDIQRLIDAAQAAGSGLLIAEAGHELLRLGGLERLQDVFDRPVLLVR